MVRLAAGLCFYEKSLASIQRTIESIKNHVDVILAIDGRFDYFPDKELVSTHDVRAYLSSIKNVVLVDCIGTEIQKRQKYCDLCKHYDCGFLLIIDSDEYILPQSNWDVFKSNLSNLDRERNIYGVRFAYAAPVHMDTTPYPRLWFRPYEIQYIKHNLWQTSLQGTVKSTSESPIVEGIIMTGNDNLHTPQYIEDGRIYQTHLINEENPHEPTFEELFEKADLMGKLGLFHKAGGSGSSNLNNILEEITKTISS